MSHLRKATEYFFLSEVGVGWRALGAFPEVPWFCGALPSVWSQEGRVLQGGEWLPSMWGGGEHAGWGGPADRRVTMRITRRAFWVCPRALAWQQGALFFCPRCSPNCFVAFGSRASAFLLWLVMMVAGLRRGLSVCQGKH